jgi:pimeloyl-ACP methyl ester carboxylesterase
MLKVGHGSPAIILEDGFGNGIEMQSSLQAELAEIACVVTYDHAGTGASDLGQEPRDARKTASELRAALTNAGVQPPFVLVGGSIGGDYCRVFAQNYADDVVGLVLLDPTPDWDQLLKWAQVHAPSRAESYRRLSEQAGIAMDEIMRHQEPGRSAEWAQLSATSQYACDALPLRQIPVIQLTGAAGRQFSAPVDDKVRFFDAWLREHIPHAEHVLAHNSAHAVAITDQELVVDQVRRLIDRLRTDVGKRIDAN